MIFAVCLRKFDPIQIPSLPINRQFDSLIDAKAIYHWYNKWLAAHNTISWQKIEKLIRSSDGKVDFNRLSLEWKGMNMERNHLLMDTNLDDGENQYGPSPLMIYDD